VYENMNKKYIEDYYTTENPTGNDGWYDSANDIFHIGNWMYYQFNPDMHDVRNINYYEQFSNNIDAIPLAIRINPDPLFDASLQDASLDLDEDEDLDEDKDLDDDEDLDEDLDEDDDEDLDEDYDEDDDEDLDEDEDLDDDEDLDEDLDDDDDEDLDDDDDEDLDEDDDEDEDTNDWEHCSQ
jgi:hypothetical protein